MLQYMARANLFGFEWLAEYIADVTNAFVKKALLPQDAGSAIECVIGEMARRQKSGGRFLNEDQIRKLLFDYLYETVFTPDIPQEAKNIPWPKGEAPSQNEVVKLQEKAELQKYSADIQRFKLRRRNIQFSQRLVEAADGLAGWFNWVKSGPTEGTFFPKETTTEGETNHFVQWIHGRGDEPTQHDNLNCWEAVFFAAYRAGLLSIARLRAIHIKATMAGRAGNGYFDSLTDSLGYQNSFPYVPVAVLIPEPGDIIFLGRDHHVAICVETGFSVKVMSNWTMPSRGFGRFDLKEFTGNGLFDVRFASLPVREQ